MKRYKLYNAIEYIKDFFAAPALTSGPSIFAEQDKQVLSVMNQLAEFVSATNGRQYWYYVVGKDEYLDLARVLLARNGIRTSVHYSEINDGVVPVLRAPSAEIRGRADLHDFVKGVQKIYSPSQMQNARKAIPAMRVQLHLDEKMR